VAPSTIPNAGLGVFTTRPLLSGHVLDGDIILPVPTLDSTTWTDPFLDFVWDAMSVGMLLETNDGIDGIEGQCPGLDALLNCHFGLLNTKRGDFEYNDDIGGSRATSCMAGSMTPYHDAKSIISRNVKAGGELFKSYGHDWFQQRTKTMGLVPFPQDYQMAERLLRKLKKVELKHNLSMAARLDLFDIVTNISFESRALNALPRHYMHLNDIMRTSIRSWYEANSTRTTLELSETGRCLDNIRHGTSTLPFAGRGAFATRNIQNGTIITGSPLVHVPTMDLAVIYDQNKTITNNSTNPNYHLWINYCLGHVDGDFLLCPYGSGINYMNHNQTLANVKLQWTPNGILSQNDEWFVKSSWTPGQVKTTHLAMDYVAIRDIEQGEELFLDYGNDFEKALQRHVENWKPSKQDQSYISASEWNKRLGNSILRTKREQEKDPYPSNLLLRCHPILPQGNWRAYPLSSKGIPWKEGHIGYSCQVISRKEGGPDPTYTVYMAEKNETRDDVPRHLLKMMDAPHSTDWHRREAFRHWIGIPDDKFPDAWRRRESNRE
jgi:hypothetical protein